jgi:hypothetical protein
MKVIFFGLEIGAVRAILSKKTTRPHIRAATCRRSVRLTPRRRPEKVANKVADDSCDQRLSPLGLGLSSLDLEEGCDGQTEALAGRT